MTESRSKTISELRRKGYAVIVWNPEELGSASVKHVENRCVELGHEVIADLQEITKQNLKHLIADLDLQKTTKENLK